MTAGRTSMDGLRSENEVDNGESYERATESTGAAVPELAALFRAGDAKGALLYIAANSQSPMYRALAKQVARLLPKGRTIYLRTPVTGDLAPKMLAHARGLVRVDKDTDTITVYLRDFGDGHMSGLRESKFLHEMIHVVVGARYARQVRFVVRMNGGEPFVF